MKKNIEVYEDSVTYDWDENHDQFATLSSHDIRDILDDYYGKRVRITIEELEEKE